jgi:hypothetical protein
MTENAATSKRSPLPDLGDIIFLVLVYLMTILRPDLIFADGSTGWHLVSGNYILNQHSIPHSDLISYTFPGKAWVAYEWLADLTMALLVKIGGFNLLAVVCACAIALISLLLYHRCRKEGGHFLLVTAIVVLGSLAASVHWLARPHLITFFGLYLYSTRLEDFYRGILPASRLLICLPLLMIIWVNSHPGFLFGLAILAIYLGCGLIEFLCTRGEEEKQARFNRIKTLGCCFLLTLTTTFFNPYFFTLYVYIIRYLRGSTVLAATDEFTSPVFHGDLQPLCLEILIGLFIVGLAISRRPISFPALTASLAFLHLTLSSQRNMPLFAIVILPVIARLFSQTIFSPSQDSQGLFGHLKEGLQGAICKLDLLDTEFTENEQLCNMHIFPSACAIILIVASIFGGRLFGMRILDIAFDPRHKPTVTLASIQQLKLDPHHGFNFDNWGGYINYQTGIPVFIDDRSDFYGEPFYFDYGTISQTLPGWPDVLKKYRINWILFPNDSRLVQALITAREWRLAARDDASSLFVRVTPILP